MGEIYKSNVKSTTLENEASLLKRKFWYPKEGTYMSLPSINYYNFKIFIVRSIPRVKFFIITNYIQHHSSARKPTEVKKLNKSPK
jgi:hypothetical protein